MKNTVIINVLSKDTIVLPFSYSSVKQTQRQGDNLVITLDNGNTIELDGFFKSPHNLLLKAENGVGFDQLIINENGFVTQAAHLSNAEADALLGSDALSALAKQSTDAVLLNAVAPAAEAGGAITDATPLYVGAASLGILGGMFALADKNGSSGSSAAAPITETNTHPDGSTTTRERKDTDGDGKFDTTITTEKDSKGNTTKETTTVDMNEDGKPEETTEVINHPDGSTTTTITKDKDGDGNADARTSETKDKYDNTTGSSETTIKRNEDGSITEDTVNKDAYGNTTGSTETTTKQNADGSTTETAVNKDAHGNTTGSTETTTKQNADGSTTETAVNKDAHGNTTGSTETTTKQNEDGSTTETAVNKDASGKTTGSTETTTKQNEDGSTTETTENKDASGHTTGSTETTTKPTEEGNVVKTIIKDENGNKIGSTEATTKQNEDGSSTTTTIAKDKDDNVTGSTEATTKQNEDGSTTTTTIAKDKDDHVTGSTEATTVKNENGSTTTVKEKDSNGQTVSTTKETTTTEDDGSTTTVTEKNKDADEHVDEKTTVNTKADGSTTTTVETSSKDNGVMDSTETTERNPAGEATSTTKQSTTTGDNGATTTVTENDKDADGHVDEKTTVNTKADGSSTTTVETSSKDNGVMDSTETTERNPEGKATSTTKESTTAGDNGATTTVTENDKDADGHVDEKTTVNTKADGSTTTTVETSSKDDGVMDSTVTTEKTADNKVTHETATTTQDGTTTTVDTKDANTNGHMEEKTTTTLNANGSKTVRTELDTNDDGKVDQITEATYDKATDEHPSLVEHIDVDTGKVIQRDIDADKNGFIDRKEYDANGDGHDEKVETFDNKGNNPSNITKVEIDADSNGRVETIKYNGNGNAFFEKIEHFDNNDSANTTPIKTEYDETPEDGNPDLIITDGNERLTKKIEYQNGKPHTISYDNNGSGDVERKDTLGNSGNETDVVERVLDINDDGNADAKITYEGNKAFTVTNENGETEIVYKPTKASFNDNYNNGADNTIDHIETYQYDNKGNVTETKFFNDGNDANNNGKADRIETNIYNAEGQLTTKYINADGETSTGKDKVVDGKSVKGVDIIETYEYNPEGLVSKKSIDGDADGNDDRTESYDYNDKGQVERITYNDNNDDTPDRIEVNKYDGNGNLIQTSFFNDGNETNNKGKADKVETYRYNEFGQMKGKDIDANGDGMIDSVEDYQLDNAGHIIKTTHSEPIGADKTGRYTGKTTLSEDYFVLDSNGNVVKKYTNADAKEGTGRAVEVTGFGNVSGIDSIEKYTNNAKGQTIKTEYNLNADNKVDKTVYFERDANGNITKKYTDFDNSTSTGKQSAVADQGNIQGIDLIETYTLNAKGKTLKAEYDFNADTKADKIDYWEVNATGLATNKYTNNDPNATVQTGHSLTINNEKVNGIDASETRYFDENNRTYKVEYSNDSGSNHKVEYLIYDDNGNVVDKLINTDGSNNTGETKTILINGVPTQVAGIDKTEHYTNNAKGASLVVEYNKDADGATTSDGSDGVKDAITYIVRDANGNQIARYFNKDGKDSGEAITVEIDGKLTTLKGIDSFERYTLDAYGNTIQTDKNFDAKGNFEEITYIARDVTGRIIGLYTDIDNNKTTGTGNDNVEKITLADGRVLAGVDKYETYTLNANGQTIQTNYNDDAKGLSERIQYIDIDSATGESKGVYDNLDADQKDGVALKTPTGETITLSDGRHVVGVDKYVTYERDSNNFVIQENYNLDGKGDVDRVIYFTRDANGYTTGRYDNLDNDTTLVNGAKTVTGQTIELADGRTVNGIERFYLYERDANGSLIKEERNLDGKDNAEIQIYNVVNEQGQIVAIYQNTDNNTNTGHQYTINGQVVAGIDRITRITRNANGAVEKNEINQTGEPGDSAFTITETNKLDDYNRVIEYKKIVTTENGPEQQIHHAYKYDPYGNETTRLIDNKPNEGDSNGFDRVETYHRDAYGNVIRVDRNNHNTDTDIIDEYTTYKNDLYNKAKETNTYDAENHLTRYIKKEFNQYGYESKSEDNNQIITIAQQDAYGRSLRIEYDKNKSGELDKGDVIYEYTYDNATGLFKSNKVSFYKSNTEVDVTNYKYSYDGLNRRIASHQDTNDDGLVNNGERVDKSYYYDNTSKLDYIEIYSGDQLVSKDKFFYLNGGSAFLGRVQQLKGDAPNTYSRIYYDGYGSQKNSVEDYTDEQHQSWIEQIGGNINRITLTSKSSSTEITLDSQTIAKLSENATGNTLKIEGDSTDSINLKDASDFAKGEDVNQSNNTYHSFTTTVEGKQYTLLVDTDINLLDADGHSVIGG
ncbi:hypothetical protein [Avibacterium sp. 21-599]|uniref:hypothetical protein n=1 Tax=Avibacterium sp. 21-599 TaxID=2911528 RepID=UPI002247E9A5|nr:hypothetical protein [Avibacterium sp. 21-599]MCW9717133.1 hypothetical protein [Avibacterium sp. 21-599]